MRKDHFSPLSSILAQERLPHPSGADLLQIPSLITRTDDLSDEDILSGVVDFLRPERDWSSEEGRAGWYAELYDDTSMVNRILAGAVERPGMINSQVFSQFTDDLGRFSAMPIDEIAEHHAFEWPGKILMGLDTRTTALTHAAIQMRLPTAAENAFFHEVYDQVDRLVGFFNEAQLNDLLPFLRLYDAYIDLQKISLRKNQASNDKPPVEADQMAPIPVSLDTLKYNRLLISHATEVKKIVDEGFEKAWTRLLTDPWDMDDINRAHTAIPEILSPELVDQVALGLEIGLERLPPDERRKPISIDTAAVGRLMHTDWPVLLGQASADVFQRYPYSDSDTTRILRNYLPPAFSYYMRALANIEVDMPFDEVITPIAAAISSRRDHDVFILSLLDVRDNLPQVRNIINDIIITDPKMPHVLKDALTDQIPGIVAIGPNGRLDYSPTVPDDLPDGYYLSQKHLDRPLSYPEAITRSQPETNKEQQEVLLTSKEPISLPFLGDVAVIADGGTSALSEELQRLRPPTNTDKLQDDLLDALVAWPSGKEVSGSRLAIFAEPSAAVEPTPYRFGIQAVAQQGSEYYFILDQRITNGRLAGENRVCIQGVLDKEGILSLPSGIKDDALAHYLNLQAIELITAPVVASSDPDKLLSWWNMEERGHLPAVRLKEVKKTNAAEIVGKPDDQKDKQETGPQADHDSLYFKTSQGLVPLTSHKVKKA